MMTAPREMLLASLAHTIRDYRAGEIPAPTAAHVQRWVSQFPVATQLILLAEMNTMLSATYVARRQVHNFLARALAEPQLVGSPGGPPPHFLRVQRKGGSQAALLSLVDEVRGDDGPAWQEGDGRQGRTFIYLDDCLFTGSTCLRDLLPVISTLPRGATLHLVYLAVYRAALADTLAQLAAAAEARSIHIRLWCEREFDTPADPGAHYDGLWPSDATLAAVAAELPGIWRGAPAGRPADTPRHDRLFSSPEARDVVERAFLRAGLDIIAASRHPDPAFRPLGFGGRSALGFGAMFFTYRNCPNNCPLALWWGDPAATPGQTLSRWYPLFDRVTHDA